MPRITGLTSPASNPLTVSIRVEGRTVARISRDALEMLGLQVDQAWTESLAAKVTEAAQYDKALKQARNRLDRRPLSGKQLRRKLVELEHSPAVADRVVQRLTEVGVLDDEAYARSLVHQWLARKPAGPRLLRVKLAQKGIDRGVIDRVLPQEMQGQDSTADARDLARRKLRSLARFDLPTKKRRLWGALARRGFDSDTIREALAGLPELTGDGDPE